MYMVSTVTIPVFHAGKKPFFHVGNQEY